MRISVLSNQSRLAYSVACLYAYEKVITGLLISMLVISMLVLVGVKFENYRLLQTLSHVEGQNQSLMVEQKKLRVDQGKIVSYLSIKNYSAKNQWQNGSMLT